MKLPGRDQMAQIVEAAEQSAADQLIAQFFERWAPKGTSKLMREQAADFHVDFVRVVQTITLEAARPYHALVADALSHQPMLASPAVISNVPDAGG